jgi:hypothetical protein
MLNMTHNFIANGPSTVRTLIARLGRGRTLRWDLPGRLQAFSGSFTQHYERTDVEFNALAKSLRQLYEISQTLGRLVGERLGVVRNALNESRIARPEGVAAAALLDLRQDLAKTEGELALLQSVGGKLGRLHSQVEDIGRIGLVIRTSVFGFAVESARTEQCRHTFGLFAGELRLLGDRIANLAEAIDRHAVTARTTLEAEWQTLSASHAQLCRLAEQLETTAGAAAAAAQAILDQVLGELQQSEDRMREITHHASEALFHLQFGDIIRQKTEHIAAALRETAGQLHAPVSRREFCAVAAAADRVIAIQIGQLELIRTEAEAAQRKLNESFHTLGETTGQMCNLLSRRPASPDGPPPQPDSLAAFKAELQRLENLQHQGRQLRRGARRSIQNVAGVSQQLTGHAGQVRMLNADLHLQALNAIVKTAALGGEGATLSVLSMHVDSLYAQSNQIVMELVGLLESVIAQTLATSENQEPALASGPDTGLRAGLENLETAFNECGATFASAQKLVAEQQTALAGSQSLLDSLVGQGPAITGQIGELTAFRKLLAPCLSAARPPAAPAETLPDRYTMQSERDVHERAGRMAAPGVNAAADETAPPPLQTEAPKGSPEPAVSGMTAAPASEMGDNVELF